MKKTAPQEMPNRIISCHNLPLDEILNIDEVKAIVKLVTSVFIRQCKHYGLYYFIMNSGLKNNLGSKSIKVLFNKVNISTIKDVVEHKKDISEIDFITAVLNKLIKYFLDGKGFIAQSKLEQFGLQCFNLICKTKFGEMFQEEKEIDSAPESWFDVFCIETYKQNACFTNTDYTTFLRSNFNILKSSYKNSDFYKFEKDGLPLFNEEMMDMQRRNQEDFDDFFFGDDEEDREDDYYDDDFPF